MITFQELGLHDKLVKAVETLGFVNPTPIQEKTIPILLQGTTDFVGLAQTGTGKTAAFGLPLLHLINAGEKHPQALVVCPTRELCMQIVNEIQLFKKFMSGVHAVAVYGGTSISTQIRDLKRGAQIVVATPGRLIDLIERKAIDLKEIKYVVLDEADEMLNMGFKEDIEFILKHTPQRESSWLFSATMPAEVKKVSKQFMENPAEVTVGKVNTTNKNIDHQYYLTTHQHRYDTLKRIIDFNPGLYGLIFARTKIETQNITDKLTREGYEVDALHGDLSQAQRDKVMSAFRNKVLKIVVATDVAARGIDVKDITHVINYELPDDIEVYTHRSGRTGRAGKTGVCMSIVSPRERSRIREIEKLVQTTFHKLEIPDGKDVCRKQFFHFVDRLLKTDISHGDYQTYIPLLEEKFQDISKQELLTRFAALEFDRFLKYYENAENLNVRDDRNRSDRYEKPGKSYSRDAKRERRDRDSDRRPYQDTKGRKFESGQDYTKLFVNLGSKDGFYKASFLQFILDMSELRKDVLGRVDLKDLNSWIEIEKGSAKKMIRAFDGKSYKGRSIRMNESDN